LKNLRKLILNYNFIGDEGAEALANSFYLSKLKVLSLEENPISSIGEWKLKKSNTLKNLIQPIFGFH